MAWFREVKAGRLLAVEIEEAIEPSKGKENPHCLNQNWIVKVIDTDSPTIHYQL